MTDSLNNQYEFFNYNDYDIDNLFDYTVKKEIETYFIMKIKERKNK